MTYVLDIPYPDLRTPFFDQLLDEFRERMPETIRYIERGTRYVDVQSAWNHGRDKAFDWIYGQRRATFVPAPVVPDETRYDMPPTETVDVTPEPAYETSQAMEDYLRDTGTMPAVPEYPRHRINLFPHTRKALARVWRWVRG
jgi:hypothetical protein